MTRMDEIRERLAEIEHELSCGFSAEVETNLYNEQAILERELEVLEHDEYWEGYRAGVEFHIDCVPMKDEWLDRSGAFSRGFDQAGQDS